MSTFTRISAFATRTREAVHVNPFLSNGCVSATVEASGRQSRLDGRSHCERKGRKINDRQGGLGAKQVEFEQAWESGEPSSRTICCYTVLPPYRPRRRSS